MKNIAIFIYDYSALGGCQRVTSSLSDLFLENDFPLKCIITIKDSNKIDYQYGVPIEHVEEERIAEDFDALIQKYDLKNVIVQVENLSLCCNVINVLEKFDCNVLPVLHGSPKSWLKLYSSYSQCVMKPILILRQLKMALYWKPQHLKYFKMMYNKHRIICVGQQPSMEMHKILNVKYPSSPIKYVYNPIHLPKMDIDMDSKSNIIIYIGRLDEDKRPMLMLNVWEKVSGEYRDWCFEILGDGPLKNKMEDYIRKHCLKNVYLRGTVSNVFPYLQKSKISLLFTSHEGLPTALVESAICGNAILATISDGGTQDVVVDGENGYLSPSNLQSLTSKLINMMKDNGKISKVMGERSMKIAKKFQLQGILKDWTALFV